MWSEQATEQESTSAPILESAILGGGEDHVIVKLLTTSSVPASSGSEVLAKLLTGSAAQGTAVAVATTGGLVLGSLPVQGLRKIEPKPAESENENEKLSEADCEANASGRFLGINATRRGVKTCPSCSKKIGYRSKQCKYCSSDKQKRRSRKQSKDSRKEGDPDMDVEIGVIIDNETVMSTARSVEVPPTGEGITKKTVGDNEPVTIESYEQTPEANINAVEGLEAEVSPQNSSDLTGGKRHYHTSLQDLIHTLLVQNQNNSVYVVPETEVQGNKVGAEDPDSNQQEEQVGGVEETGQGQDSSVVPAGTVGSPENVYDANSVALFLGHLAQQNGKKLRTALDPVSSNAQPNPSASSVIRFKTKHEVVEDDMSSLVKYRRIRPKSVDEGTAVMEIPSRAESTVEGEVAESAVQTKPTESQLRMLPGNATRRGVMPCQKCQCLIGCRSKVCKHCKFLLNEANPPFRRGRKHLLQAVQLQIPFNSVATVFSVRRSKVGPDHRCLVWCERSDSENSMGGMYSCDYPPCVTAKELGDKSVTFLCEHAKICCSQTLTSHSRVLELNEEKLSSECLTEEVSESLRELNKQCSNKGVSMVQSVSDKTFVVADQFQTDQGGSLATDLIGFVHVRFERAKVNGLWQTQVFCSGRPCMAWNPVFSCVSQKRSSLPTVLRSVNCIHYSACLWAITSDEKLEHDFKVYVDGARARANSSETS